MHFTDHQDTFHYLNQGSSPKVQGLNDLEEFDKTVTALTMLGFSNQDQVDLFKILAGILHLGNIQFEQCLIQVQNEQDQDGCLIRVSVFWSGEAETKLWFHRNPTNI